MKVSRHLAAAALLVLAPAVILLSGGAEARGKRRPRRPVAIVTATPDVPAEVVLRGGNRIVVSSPGVKARTAFTANAHEGLADLSISPDHRWATAMVVYPYDIVGAEKTQQYRIVVHLRTGARLDLEDFPRHFALDCTVRDFAFDPKKTATLDVSCADGRTIPVDLPEVGVPQIPGDE